MTSIGRGTALAALLVGSLSVYLLWVDPFGLWNREPGAAGRSPPDVGATSLTSGSAPVDPPATPSNPRGDGQESVATQAKRDGISSESAAHKNLALQSIEELRAKSRSGNVDAMIELAKKLAATEPVEENFAEALRWLDEGVVLGSSDAAMVQGEICIKACSPPDALDPHDYENWSRATRYYFVAYLMGDERALQAIERITPLNTRADMVYDALGIARMMLEDAIAERARRGLGPLQMNLNATSPYQLPNPPPGARFQQPPSPPPDG
jgi:hypothetical protein